MRPARPPLPDANRTRGTLLALRTAARQVSGRTAAAEVGLVAGLDSHTAEEAAGPVAAAAGHTAAARMASTPLALGSRRVVVHPP